MSNVTDSYFIRLTRLELVVNGVFSPFVIVLTVLTNSLVCAVLLRRHMRSKTNSILVGMAVADTLTGICPLPSHVTGGHTVRPLRARCHPTCASTLGRCYSVTAWSLIQSAYLTAGAPSTSPRSTSCRRCSTRRPSG